MGCLKDENSKRTLNSNGGIKLIRFIFYGLIAGICYFLQMYKNIINATRLRLKIINFVFYHSNIIVYMINLELIFKDYGLKKTPFRKELLELFYAARSSLTVEEIKSKVTVSKDKVTIYRALDAFEQNGLIHRVPDKTNLTRYALCQSECNSDQHIHNHAHFICDNCNETFCIQELKPPVNINAKGFHVKKSKLTLEGICSYCQ